MAHNIEYFTYPKNVNKASVQKDLNNYVAHADWQEGCTGLYRDIRWLDEKVYDSEEEAHAAINRMDRGDYDQIAVLYQEYENVEDDKSRALYAKLQEASKEYYERNRLLYSNTVTSAFIGCKKCGSRLARTFLHDNYCPVCKAELRPDHMLKAVSAAKNRMEKANKNYNDYTFRKSKKNGLCWLVKIEYHT